MRPALRAIALAVTTVLLAAAAPAKAPVLRQEGGLDFAVDDAFLADGGVQYFYELSTPKTVAKSTAFAQLRPLDFHQRWGALEKPLNVIVSRLVYRVDRDVSFFSESRVKDVGYMNAVAKDYGITAEGDGGFHASKTPANHFTVDYLDATAIGSAPPDGGVAALSALQPDAGLPSVLVVQENTHFERVMGWRTGEMSVTWTAHRSKGPGRTELEVCTVSYLHNLPPFFLGGEDRVRRESHEAAIELITRLRDYRDGKN